MSSPVLRLAAVFSDHAVLQQGIMVPVWGWMKPRARVRARLGAYTAQSLSGADGKFLVRLPAMPAGGPFELVVESLEDGQSVRRQDVWVGEVWLASGQSNMQWKVNQLGFSAEEETALRTDAVRMANVPNFALAGRQSEIDVEWARGDSDTLGDFSAVGYYFAKRLSKDLGVKVGILNTSWGGTIVEAWTSRETLSRNPDVAHWLGSYENTVNSEAFWATCAELDLSDPASRKTPEAVSKAYPADPGNEGYAKGWAAADFDDASWKAMKLPATWKARGEQYNGALWFRKTVEVPADWAGRDLELGIGAVDKHDVTYFNGEQVGATGTGFEEQYWCQPRKYTVPGRLVKAGTNVIAVRAFSFVYDGGLIGPGSRMRLGLPGSGKEPLPLVGMWKFQTEHNLGLVVPSAQPLVPGPGCPNSPGILFDNMVAPLIPYAVRGAIWYQGESNADVGRFSVNAKQYQRAMVDMIRDWRFYWGQGDFAFLQVQLANFRGPDLYQSDSNWALLRESQRLSLSEPNTGMAVIIDAGEEADIHPKDKKTVGDRLAQWALAETYHQPIVASGPLYDGMAIEPGQIRIRFRNTGGGLVAQGGALQTFYISGAEMTFFPAKAVIEGNTVVVSSPEVDAPLAVRYAWADNPEGCNLYNVEGIPASPFRTDWW